MACEIGNQKVWELHRTQIAVQFVSLTTFKGVVIFCLLKKIKKCWYLIEVDKACEINYSSSSSYRRPH